MKINNFLFGSISDSNKWVYHYTSRETALEFILSSGKIRLNLFKYLNDPRESKDWSFSMSAMSDAEDEVTSCFERIQEQGTRYVKSHCKVLCMVKDDPRAVLNNFDYMFHRGYSRPRMWAQYANNHTGVCLIFDRDELQKTIESTLSSSGDLYFDDVQYLNYHPDEIDAFHLNYEDIKKSSLEAVLDKKVNMHYKKYFFTKAEDWNGENEWRCLFRGRDVEAEFISIKESIRGIVVGANFQDVYEPSISPFGKEFSIPISKIHWLNGKPMIAPGPYDINA